MGTGSWLEELIYFSACLSLLQFTPLLYNSRHMEVIKWNKDNQLLAVSHMPPLKAASALCRRVKYLCLWDSSGEGRSCQQLSGEGDVIKPSRVLCMGLLEPCL